MVLSFGCLLAAAAVTAATARELHVAVGGVAAGVPDGSQAAPFPTVHAARDTLRRLPQGGTADASIACVVR